MLVHLQKYSLLKFYVEFKLNYSAVADISIIFSAVAYINSMFFFSAVTDIMVFYLQLHILVAIIFLVTDIRSMHPINFDMQNE